MLEGNLPLPLHHLVYSLSHIAFLLYSESSPPPTWCWRASGMLHTLLFHAIMEQLEEGSTASLYCHGLTHVWTGGLFLFLLYIHFGITLVPLFFCLCGSLHMCSLIAEHALSVCYEFFSRFVSWSTSFKTWWDEKDAHSFIHMSQIMSDQSELLRMMDEAQDLLSVLRDFERFLGFFLLC